MATPTNSKPSGFTFSPVRRRDQPYGGAQSAGASRGNRPATGESEKAEMLPTETLWDIDQMAAYFRKSPMAIHQQRHRGQNPGALGIKVGNRILFDPATVRAWVQDEIQKAQEAF